MIDVFTAVSDPTRRRMLELLRAGELAAGALVQSFPGASQPGISRHLRVLRETGLVDVRRSEQKRIYSLRPQGFAEFGAWVSRCCDSGPGQLSTLAKHPDSQGPAPEREPKRRNNP